MTVLQPYLSTNYKTLTNRGLGASSNYHLLHEAVIADYPLIDVDNGEKHSFRRHSRHELAPNQSTFVRCPGCE
jgi:hypothetical protein